MLTRLFCVLFFIAGLLAQSPVTALRNSFVEVHHFNEPRLELFSGVVFHRDSDKKWLLAVHRDGKKVFQIKEGDPRLLPGGVLNSPNQSYHFLTTWDQKSMLFGLWCEPREVGPAPTTPIYKICQGLELDLATGKVVEVLRKGEQVSSFTTNGPIQTEYGYTVLEMEVPFKHGRKYYAVLTLQRDRIQRRGIFEFSIASDGKKQFKEIFFLHYQYWERVTNVIVSPDGEKVFFEKALEGVYSFPLSAEKQRGALPYPLFAPGELPAGSQTPLRHNINERKLYAISYGTKVLYEVWPEKKEVLSVTDPDIWGMPRVDGLIVAPFFGGNPRRISRLGIWQSGEYHNIVSPDDIVDGKPIIRLSSNFNTEPCGAYVPELDMGTNGGKVTGRVFFFRPVLIKSGAEKDGVVEASGCFPEATRSNLEIVANGVIIYSSNARTNPVELVSASRDKVIFRIPPALWGKTEFRFTIHHPVGRVETVNNLSLDIPRPPTPAPIIDSVGTESVNMSGDTVPLYRCGAGILRGRNLGEKAPRVLFEWVHEAEILDFGRGFVQFVVPPSITPGIARVHLARADDGTESEGFEVLVEGDACSPPSEVKKP